jgi:serine/threonine-protein kinase
MGLTQKILAFISFIVVVLAGATLAFTTFRADRLAHQTITQALSETREIWDTFEADRYGKLKLGIRVLANDAPFKAAVETGDESTVFDMLKERGADIQANFFVATNPEGVVVARTDRPGGQGQDLSADPLVQRPLEGDEAATVWPQGDGLFHAVSVPMLTGPELKGVLIAGYAVDEALAGQIRKLTHSETAYLVQAAGQPPRLVASTLGTREAALRGALGQPPFASGAEAAPFELTLGGERYVATLVPLRAEGGGTVGAFVALRSLGVEMAAFRQFRNTLVTASLAVMALALGLAYVAAARITGPVRNLVGAVEKARDGTYTGKVSVETGDEIGVLARAFNNLMTDLREKEQMIHFLREGLTVMKKEVTGSQATTVAATGQTADLRGVTLAAALAKGAVFAGRYEIQDTIGRGGMGVVYRAVDRQLDEVVALKLVRSEAMLAEPTLLERFKQEIKLARRVTHRNVLRTHDFGEAEGVPYISMEYIDGVTLKDLLHRKGALPPGVGLRVAKQICAGLDAAHQKGVVHRDIKPQNVLVLPESGEVKLMDFGIACVSQVRAEGSGGGLTTAGMVMGTPDYMSPEQAQGHPVDFRSDVYSLGVVFFEMFAGRLPYVGQTVMDVIIGHIQKPAPAARSLNPSLPVSIEAIIQRCMEKKPEARYGKVADLLQDLTSVSTRAETAA